MPRCASTTGRDRFPFPDADGLLDCENRRGMSQLARTSVAQTATTFRDRMERLEQEWLSPLGTRSYPARRELPEPDSDHRTPFQRDRDRIVHCKAFRRLK